MRPLSHDSAGPGRLAFSPGGRWLYGSFEPTLVGWDLAGGDDRPAWSMRVPCHGPCRRLVCSPCGRWLVQSSQHEVKGFDLVDQPVLSPAPSWSRGTARDVAFTPDGAELLTVDGPIQPAGQTGCVDRWRVGAWSQPDEPPHFRLKPARGVVRGVASLVAVSPDGARVAAQTYRLRRDAPFRYERTLTVWDWARDQVVADGPAAETLAEQLVFTADGTGLLADLGVVLVRYDAADLRQSADFSPSVGSPLSDLTVSPDGRWVVVGAGERLVLLDPTTLRVGAEYDFALGSSTRVAVAPDGLTAAACGASGHVVLFDLD